MDIDYLKSLGEPSFFGLGFLQLKADNITRYHFWHPDLDGSEFANEWHDHRYSFVSSVLIGSITNELVMPEMVDVLSDPSDDTVYDLISVCCAGNPPFDIGKCRVIPIGEFTTYEGGYYNLDHGAFHRTIVTGKCMTQLTRGPVVKDRARVITPNHAGSPFVPAMSSDRMWEIIRDIVGPPSGYHIAKITRGETGEISKIQEELDELIDAHAQGSRVMELVELSDLVGAIQLYLDKYHAGYSLDDLGVMSRITARAFRNGARS